MTPHPIQSQPENSVALFQFKLQYSREEAAELIGISLRTLDRLIAEKQIAVRRIGRRVLIGKDVLAQFVKRDSRTAVIQ
jgi:excisionase family DNA binding protein